MKLVVRLGWASLVLASVCLLFAHSASAVAIIGHQTFDVNIPGNNNSGINDTTADSNSTYDATPVGSISSQGSYLTSAIGAEASSLGRDGRGQNGSGSFLNGPGFGNETSNPHRLLTNITLADGSPGAQTGPSSSWKFDNVNNDRMGDIRLTNHSDYFFKLTHLNFDARVGNANAPHNLEIKYLTGNGTVFDNALTRYDTSAEIGNLVNVYNNDFGAATGTYNVSRSLGEATGTQLYLAPGQSAAFRFVWTGQATSAGQAQMDNIAWEGKFYTAADLGTEIDPVSAIPEPTTAALLALGLAGLAMRQRARS